MAAQDDRKKRIKEHLARSTGNFISAKYQNPEQRKRQILDHVDRSKGE